MGGRKISRSSRCLFWLEVGGKVWGGVVCLVGVVLFVLSNGSGELVATSGFSGLD